MAIYAIKMKITFVDFCHKFIQGIKVIKMMQNNSIRAYSEKIISKTFINI